MPECDKVSQAIADGLELPVRSDHEWVGDFSTEITALHAEKFANGMPSIELTSMELWGHMGVFPLTPDPTKPNAGAPLWQHVPDGGSPRHGVQDAVGHPRCSMRCARAPSRRS